jgi:hypothetical protein
MGGAVVGHLAQRLLAPLQGVVEALEHQVAHADADSAMPFSGSIGLRRIARWKWSIATSGRLA